MSDEIIAELEKFYEILPEDLNQPLDENTKNKMMQKTEEIEKMVIDA